jgi:ribosome-associated protein
VITCQIHIMFGGYALEANELVHTVVETIAGKKSTNVLALDVRNITMLADYYVLCDGTSSRQIKAISDELLEKLKWAGTRLATVEGSPESGWVLVDFGSVIVHVFSSDQRAYYQLEELWKNAPVVVRML